uniref:Uncharacterized protein n=1 Tax=Lepeophtheirus salmonis TaxID=72036 RepID=A0A0K2T271_LEPSM
MHFFGQTSSLLPFLVNSTVTSLEYALWAISYVWTQFDQNPHSCTKLYYYNIKLFKVDN